MAETTSAMPPPIVHPPYEKMIVEAIMKLKESNGSSKESISNYIIDSYSGGLVGHTGLLTHHLRRLVVTGTLAMVGDSYKLRAEGGKAPHRPRGRPKKDPATGTKVQAKRKVGRPKKTPAPENAGAGVAAKSGEKRKRGRPAVAKKKGLVAASGAEVNPGPQRKRGPPKRLADSGPGALGPKAPVVLAGTRKRGRPPKVLSVVVQAKKRGRPPKSVVVVGVKKLGRPRKNLPVVVKRRGRPPLGLKKPGRPRKVGGDVVVKPVDDVVVKQVNPAVTSGEKRKPGRPPKNPDAVPPLPKLVTAIPIGKKRKRGRPRIISSTPVKPKKIVTENLTGAGVVKRGRGRPPKNRDDSAPAAKELGTLDLNKQLSEHDVNGDAAGIAKTGSGAEV